MVTTNIEIGLVFSIIIMVVYFSIPFLIVGNRKEERRNIEKLSKQLERIEKELRQVNENTDRIMGKNENAK
ncbi:MAG: hypothetical protein UEJ45_04610 [Peptococcaceae bacterium]|nr:hypothetical protein [Peptococcaceae bacterium]